MVNLGIEKCYCSMCEIERENNAIGMCEDFLSWRQTLLNLNICRIYIIPTAMRLGSFKNVNVVGTCRLV